MLLTVAAHKEVGRVLELFQSLARRARERGREGGVGRGRRGAVPCQTLPGCPHAPRPLLTPNHTLPASPLLPPPSPLK